MGALFKSGSGLMPTDLTRRRTGPDGRSVVYTAVDVETTGLGDSDRIVELATVVFRDDGEILDEFTSVVDPVTASTSATSGYHGLTDEEVASAPRAEVVLPQLWRISAGTVLVAHNFVFERQFLETESRRAGLSVPAMLSLCTLRTARVQLDGHAFSLMSLYKTATGRWLADSHTALADARAVSVVLCWMLGEAPGGLHLQDWPPPPADRRYASIPPGRSAPRPTPMLTNQLGDFVRRFPRSRAPTPTTPDAESRYLSVLTRVVSDERITLEEATELEAAARGGGLTRIQLEELHRRVFFLVLGDEARIPPAQLSSARRQKLFSLSRALGLDHIEPMLFALVKADRAAAKQPGTGYLKGWRIGLDATEGGDLAGLRALVEQHNGSIAKKLTKTVRFVVATAAGSAVQAKAHALGIPVISPMEATRRLNKEIREADLAAVERQQFNDRREAQRAERDRYFRHSWKRAEDPAAADWQPDQLQTWLWASGV